MSNYYSPEFAYKNVLRVGLSVVEFVTTRAQHGRLGNPSIPKGTTLYALAYEGGGYYTYSYMKMSDAIMAMNNMIANGTNTKGYEDFNIVYNLDSTRHISGKIKRTNRKRLRENWRRVVEIAS